mgnify:CR=1 FL=1
MRFRAALLLVSTALAAAGNAFAQEEGMIAIPPNYAPSGFYSTKQEDAGARGNILSTKPAVPAPATPGTATMPWQTQTLSPRPDDVRIPVEQPVAAPARPVPPPQGRFPAGYVPFGKASAEVTAPVPSGPRETTAVPVEDVGIMSEELEPAKAPEPSIAGTKRQPSSLVHAATSTGRRVRMP